MVYDFDTVYDRVPTSSEKWSLLKEKTGSDDVLPLWVADMDFACAPEIVSALRERVDHPIYGYTTSSDGYYDSLMSWMARRHGWKGVERDWIASSPGVIPGFSACIEAYSSPGDKVVIQPPVYHPFKMAIDNNGRQLVENPLKVVDGSYVMDYEDLERKIDERTKMIIFCSPHNPVGRVWRRDEVRRVMEICEKKDIVMVSDEIHHDLILGEVEHACTAMAMPEAMKRTVTFVSPSKTFNLAGLSNSTAIIPDKKLRDAFLNVNRNHGYWFVNTFGMVSQEAAYAKGEPWLEELLAYLRANSAYMGDFLKKRIPQLKMYPLEGTYLAWVDCSALGMDDAALHSWMLEKAKLWLDDGTMFGTGGSTFMRFNIACPRSILTEALERLERAVAAK